MKPLAMGIMQKHNQCAKSGGFAEIDALCFDWRSLHRCPERKGLPGH